MSNLPESILLLTAAKQAMESEAFCVVVSVVATRGSAPRQAGASMLVGAQSVFGTVGGGHLEFAAIALARTAFELPFDKVYPLGASLGQCCGGAMSLRFERLNAQHIAAFTAQYAAFKTLYLFGSGHVARAVQAAVAALPLRVVWTDSREAVNDSQSTFPAPLPAHVSTQISDAPEEALESAEPGDLALIMTHSHALDEVLVQAALRTPALAYIGLIGSATKRRLFEQRLAQRGLCAADFERLICPIGQPYKPTAHSKLPAVIAAQIAAQLTQYV